MQREETARKVTETLDTLRMWDRTFQNFKVDWDRISSINMISAMFNDDDHKRKNHNKINKLNGNNSINPANKNMIIS